MLFQMNPIHSRATDIDIFEYVYTSWFCFDSIKADSFGFGNSDNIY